MFLIFYSKVKPSFSFLLVSIMLQFMLVFFLLASGFICHVIIKFANSFIQIRTYSKAVLDLDLNCLTL